MANDATFLVSRLLEKINTNIDLKELTAGSSWALILKFSGMGVGYLLTLVVSRLLGAEAWGSFSLGLTVATIGSIFGRLGVDTALLRLIAESKTKGQGEIVANTYWMGIKITLPVTVFISVIVYFMAPELAEYVFNKPHLDGTFRISSFAILPLVLSMLNTQSLRGLKKIKEYAFFDLVARHLLTLLVLFIVFAAYRQSEVVILAFTIAMYLILIASSIVLFCQIRKTDTDEVQINALSITYRQIFSIALPLFLASSINFLKGWIDTLMIGIYMTEADVGIYNVALKFSILINVPLTAINTIAAPKFAEFYGKNDLRGLGRFVQQSTKMIFLFSLPIFCGIVLFPKLIMGVLGQEFRVGWIALLVLSFGQFVNAISGSVGYLLQMAGEQRYFQNITVLTVLLGIVFNSLLIPSLGINGAALATFITLVTWNLACVFHIRRKFGFFSIISF